MRARGEHLDAGPKRRRTGPGGGPRPEGRDRCRPGGLLDHHPLPPSAGAHRPGNGDLSALVIRDVLDRESCVGLDLKSCACAGFVRAVQVMDGLLHDPNHRAGLIVCAEQTSRLAVADSNRSTFCFILGDAAGATVLRRTERHDADGLESGLIDHTGRLAPAGLDLIGFGDDGKSLVVRGERAGEAVRQAMFSSARELLRRNHLTVTDGDWLLPVQAHVGIIQGLCDELRSGQPVGAAEGVHVAAGRGDELGP
ncbi:hypothetical protein, partial [Streptomyces lavendulae]|uniref:hypothetical protein n=1 Tax=Streptomyces lavendulae TaxID=1914 RepID=UPI0031F128BF